MIVKLSIEFKAKFLSKSWNRFSFSSISPSFCETPMLMSENHVLTQSLMIIIIILVTIKQRIESLERVISSSPLGHVIQLLILALIGQLTLVLFSHWSILIFFFIPTYRNCTFISIKINYCKSSIRNWCILGIFGINEQLQIIFVM